jgi:hypothetical protein
MAREKVPASTENRIQVVRSAANDSNDWNITDRIQTVKEGSK